MRMCALSLPSLRVRQPNRQPPGGRALPYHVCVPRIRPGGQFQGGFCHLRTPQNLGQKVLLYSYMPTRGKDERKFWITLLSLNVTLFFLLLSFPLCSSFLERKIGWKELGVNYERKFWIMLLSLNVTLFFLLLSFPLCSSFLERKIGWKSSELLCCG